MISPKFPTKMRRCVEMVGDIPHLVNGDSRHFTLALAIWVFDHYHSPVSMITATVVTPLVLHVMFKKTYKG